MDDVELAGVRAGVGGDDGAAGGEAVRCGADGRGEDEAVGDEGVDLLAVDEEAEVDDAGEGGAGDDDVVEGGALPEEFAAAVDFGAEHHEFDGFGDALCEAVEGGSEFLGADFGEEAEFAEVDAEEGDAGAGDAAGGGEDGAVAAEYEAEGGADGFVLDVFAQFAPEEAEAGGEAVLGHGERSGGPTRGTGVLTPREREVLGRLALGLTGSEAARDLGISPETVRVHVRNAMRRLGARTRVQAIGLALAAGEIGVGDPERP